VSFLGWFRRVRVDWFSSARHWADVMAEADALQADHDGAALEVAEEEERKAKEAETRHLFRDVGSVLEGREEPPTREEGGDTPKPPEAPQP
jgi:hypothetical protein